MNEAESTLLAQNDSSDSRSLFPLTRVPMEDINELPPEILNRVFCLLDKGSLRHTRLVCRKWNEFALKILSKIPGTVSLRVDNPNHLKEKQLEAIKKLQSILNFTEYPGMFFTNLELFTTKLVADIDIQLLTLLQKFGPTLKSLKLSVYILTLPILRPMLENWCTNLEELTIDDIKVREDNHTTIADLETSPTPLQLKLRTLKVRDDTKIMAPQNLIAYIIKSSPKLQVLHVDVQYWQSFLWKEIQKLPNITKNLEKVKIQTYPQGLEDLSLIEKVPFSNKLTSLRLKIEYTTFPKEQLVALLKKVGESLEKLFLSVDTPDMREGQLSYWKIELPFMNKLKVLEHSFHCELLFESIDFLKYLPNLEILRLSCSHGKKCTIRFEFVDALFCNASYLPMHPHTTLHTLFLKGSPKNPETIFALNRIFPNLRDLTLVVKIREIPVSTRGSWLSKIFTGLSEMENLKILHLHLLDSLAWNQGVNLGTCFSPLEALESLEELTITISFLVSGFDKGCPPGLKKVFLKIPKLKVLTINRLVMERSETIKLLKTLDQKVILVKTALRRF